MITTSQGDKITMAGDRTIDKETEDIGCEQSKERKTNTSSIDQRQMKNPKKTINDYLPLIRATRINARKIVQA